MRVSDIADASIGWAQWCEERQRRWDEEQNPYIACPVHAAEEWVRVLRDLGRDPRAAQPRHIWTLAEQMLRAGQ